jgi:hypothetical protein
MNFDQNKQDEYDLAKVIKKLEWMENNKIWPNGLRYLWTDAFGLVLLVSLYQKTKDEKYLVQSQTLVKDVRKVLGRKRGIRIGEEPDRDGQYYHYLIMWIFALWRLGQVDKNYADMPINLVKEIHKPFLNQGVGVYWKMKEDLSGPYPGYGYGAMDHLDGYVVYRLIDKEQKFLKDEIKDMEILTMKSFKMMDTDQDLGAGMTLWLTHFFPQEEWSIHLRKMSLKKLDKMWVDPPGYFCRATYLKSVKFAFTNFGISLGLRAIGVWGDRVTKLNNYFEDYKSEDEYDYNSITHVMYCTSHFPGKFLKDEN